MEKIIVEKEVFYGEFNDPISLAKIRELASKKDVIILDTDVVIQEENDNYSAYDVSVLRHEMETDAEFEKRKESNEKMKEKLKEGRRRRYLDLKREFEDE